SSIRIRMTGRQDFRRDDDVDGKLFTQLACEALVKRLARIALAAGKFPVVLEMRPFQSTRHEKPSVALDDGRGDDDGRHLGVNGNERQLFDIGHTRHFGLRAEQTIAPKSISAWLKSNTSRGSTAADTDQRCFVMAWLFGSPLATNTRNSTRATFVSRMAARSRNAKLR